MLGENKAGFKKKLKQNVALWVNDCPSLKQIDIFVLNEIQNQDNLENKK